MEKDTRTIDKEFTLKEYQCGFCGYRFKQFVRAIMTSKPTGYDDTKACSSQVRCAYCGAFINTWKEGKVVGVYKKKPNERVSKRKYEIDEEVKLK